MKFLLQILRFIVIILLILDLFLGGIANGSGHKIPFKTNLFVIVTAIILTFVILFLNYFINFYFKGKPAENDRVAINISDAAGQMVRTINCALPRAAAARGPQGGGGGGGFFGGGRGTQCTLQQGFNRAVWDYRGNSLTPPGGENQAISRRLDQSGTIGD